MRMSKKLLLLTLLIAALFTSFLPPSHIQAQDNISVVKTWVDTSFPDTMTFNINVSGAAPITKIYLRYSLVSENPIRVFSEEWLSFQPSTSVEARWVWRLKTTGGLPPGTDLKYWWVITDEKGNTLETAPRNYIYFDLRYSWKFYERGNIFLAVARGDDNFANQLLSAAQQAIDRLEQNAGVKLEKKVKIFVYPGDEELRQAILFSSEWTGGMAFTEFSILVLGVRPGDLDWGKRVLTHELAHIVVRQESYNFYNDLPNWLNEGLAMWNEGSQRPDMQQSLRRAIEAGSFPSLRTLSSPFPSDTRDAFLAYAVSESVVEYLLNRYDRSKMPELLRVFKEGSGYDEALIRVYGFNMDQLFEMWRDSILSSNRTAGPEAFTVKV